MATATALPRKSTPSPAAYRAVQVLEALSRAPRPMTLTEVSLAVDMPKSSTANLLTTLESAGMVRKHQGGWAVGFKALEIGQAAIKNTDAAAAFHDVLKGLPALAAETVLLAMLDGLHIVYLARHTGHHPMRLTCDVGGRKPAVVTGLGKAMLAQLDTDELDDRLQRMEVFPMPTNRSHSSVESLRRDLVETRTRGYAVDFEENTIGVSCFAVALDAAPRAMAVSVTMPSQRVTPELHQQLVGELRHLARAIEVVEQ